MTRGKRVIEFIEQYCYVPEGDRVGLPVELADFQKKFILDVYDNPEVTDTAILSIARKNAKTATIAFLVLAHVVGPESVRNSRIVSGAMSRDQAGEVYNLAAKSADLSPELRAIVRPIPSSKKLIGLPMNVEYQAISAEGKTAHGKSPILAIIDEVGQIRGPRSDFVDAITTSQGAYDNPLLIYISTQAANDGDLFSILIDDAEKNRNPHTVCHVYAAKKEADLMDRQAWMDANPALGCFRAENDLKKQAEKAARMPSFENTFRNLNLNQRVSSESPFISKSVWIDCGGVPDDMERFKLYGGLDLSAKTDLTAFVLVGHGCGILHVWPYFWTPEEGLLDRCDRDRQPYDVWVRQGFLRTTPGRTVDYEFVITEIMDIVGDANLVTLGFDRWKIDFFEKDCDRLGVELPLEPFGQGFKDMAPAIDSFEEYLLNGKICHGQHPVLTMCAANACVVVDPAKNRKLDKIKSTGRIDGIVALAMAIGMLNKQEPEQVSPWEDEEYSLTA